MEDAPATNPNDAIIAQFSNITSASTQEATFYLESHNYDLDSALSTFFEATAADDVAGEHAPPENTHSPVSSSPSRSRSISPPPSLGLQQLDGGNPYNLRSRNTAAEKKASGSRSSGRIRTFADLNRTGGDSGSDSDEPQEYYTGGEKRFNCRFNCLVSCSNQ
ncbi:putative UBA-like superfamily protein [Helianthus annuus]|nr:putative UBA-like superfamily protein [Helianthus annuus]